MKFLQIILFLCFYNCITDSQMNYNKINHKHPNNLNTILFRSSDLPIQNKRVLYRRVYKNKFNGTDDRYPVSENNTEEINYKIYENIENKRKLDFLQNDHISIYNKLELLRDSSIKPPDLAAGRLMDDYNFDLKS